MCGIAGWIERDADMSMRIKLLNNMSRTLEKRGPDENGIYIMNPGSASSPRDGKKPSYGIIDITKSGILMNIADV